MRTKLQQAERRLEEDAQKAGEVATKIDQLNYEREEALGLVLLSTRYNNFTMCFFCRSCKFMFLD